MPNSTCSRVLVFLTLLGALLTFASWLGRADRLVLFLIVGFFAVQAVPVYLIYSISQARHRRRVLESIEIIGGRITARLAADPQCILELDLSGTNLAELKWDSLHTLSHLESLNLAGTSLTDDRLETLARLPALRHLDLENTAITNAGLPLLRSFPRLETISLTKTAITDDGLEMLFHACPRLLVEADHLPPLDHLAPLKDVTHDANI